MPDGAAGSLGSLDVATLTALRQEVRDFLAAEVEAGLIVPRPDAWLAGHDPAFSARLGARGWLGMTLPQRYGGQGRSAVERFVVTEELLAAGSPVAAHWLTDRQTGPTILRFGTEEQRQRFLPPIARGECFFAAGLSEPDSGSDLASVRTRAVRDGDEWVINGTKVWTSHIHRSHFVVVLCRTSPRTDDRHAGLSQFIVDVATPGILIRPIRLLTGEHHFNEVVFDDVRVPASTLLGEEGAGWAQITAELSYERSGPERFLSTFVLLEHLRGGGDRGTSLALGSLLASLTALRHMSSEVAATMDAGVLPDSVSCAIVKDLGSRFEKDVAERARLALDPMTASNAFRRDYQEAVLHSPGFSLRGGTSEILQGIIARGLGVR